MTTKVLSLKQPPSLAVSENATTPTGAAGVQIWSTIASKLLFWDGSKWAAFAMTNRIDGGGPSSTYLASQKFDGGAP